MLQVSINVLAHNEEQYLEPCLDSIEHELAQHAKLKAKVRVIANGCQDQTYKIAKDYCSPRKHWYAYQLALGDKANAWNYALAKVAAAESLSIFIDGDCTMVAGSLSGFLQSASANPNAYVLAACPLTQGRDSPQTVRNTLNGEALSGNLYALTSLFLQKIHQTQFRLPIGLIGDDSLLAWVASHNFHLTNGVSKGRLVGVPQAQFSYHRLSPRRLNDIYLYWRRLMRYSLRHLQQNAIREHLTEYDDFASLPAHIDELYAKVQLKHLRLRSRSSLFDLINYLKIKKSA